MQFDPCDVPYVKGDSLTIENEATVQGVNRPFRFKAVGIPNKSTPTTVLAFAQYLPHPQNIEAFCK